MNCINIPDWFCYEEEQAISFLIFLDIIFDKSETKRQCSIINNSKNIIKQTTHIIISWYGIALSYG